jgi:recombinational DNA repair protein (RecF pathway)
MKKKKPQFHRCVFCKAREDKIHGGFFKEKFICDKCRDAFLLICKFLGWCK